MISVVRPFIASRRPSADLRLGGRVDRGGRVVQHEDPRVDRERPGDREPLPLAARERDPALADDGVVAVGEAFDELVRLREPRRALDARVGELGRAEGDVLAHGVGEEERVLRDDADRAAERGQREVADVEPSTSRGRP